MIVNNRETEVTLGSLVIVILIMVLLIVLAVLAHEYLGFDRPPDKAQTIKSCCCADLPLPVKEKTTAKLPEPMIVERDIEQELGPEALIGDGPASAMKPKPYKKKQ